MHHHVEAGLGRDLRDSGSHGSGAEHADTLYLAKLAALRHVPLSPSGR